ncbi:MAG TPA: DUF3761 domain-containing protein [Rhodocyclaceae bacterium]|nr:DUF3761 domain-containing protein [Rhodocyclaceae bacterium]
MKKLSMPVAALCLLISGYGFAQAPAGAPAGSTALCKDGSYFSGATKSGACRGHKGIKDWFGGDAPAAKTDAKTTKADEKAAKAQAKADEKAAKARAKADAKAAKEEAKAAKAKGATAAQPAEAAKPAPAVKAAAPAAAAPAALAPAAVAPAASAPKAAAPMAAPAAPVQKPTAPAAGGPGMVWVNASTKVYHCSGTRWYGKTKQGEYMSESEAQAKGFRGDHNKACGS